MVLCPLLDTATQLVNGMALLTRIDDGSKPHTWMSISPMEIESQEIGQHARGHVVVMGLGMGWAAANAALHPAVSQVTVVDSTRK